MGFKCGRKSIKQETNRSNIHLTISINVKPIHGPPNHDTVRISVFFTNRRNIIIRRRKLTRFAY